MVPLASALGLSDSQLTPLRVLKSLRLARIMRLLESFSELNTLVKGVARGVHVTLTTLSLLALVIYMFAISLTVIREGTPSSHGCFDSVLPAMNCLMVQGVFADQASMIQRMLAADVVYYYHYFVDDSQYADRHPPRGCHSDVEAAERQQGCGGHERDAAGRGVRPGT